MKKQGTILWSVICVCALGIGIVYTELFTPVPVLSEAYLNEAAIVGVQLHRHLEDGRVESRKVTGFDEAAVLSYLTGCEERRTYDVAGDYQFGRIELELILELDDSYKYIYLGDHNFTSCGRGSRIHKVMGAGQVKEALWALLNI